MDMLTVRHFVVFRYDILIGHGILWCDSSVGPDDGWTEILMLGSGRWRRPNIYQPTFSAALREARVQWGRITLRWLDRSDRADRIDGP